jgi:tetratricopeptide (TPR) repeat protein
MASWDFDRAREIVEMNSKAQTSLYGVDHLVQGIVLEYALGRFDEVFSLVEKFNAGIENPLDWWGNLLAFGYFQSALCYRGLGQFDDSLDFFTKIYPDSKNILFSEQKSFFEYARILNYSGDTEAALKVLDQAVVKFPGMNNYCYPLRDVILHTQNKSEISSELVGSWLECARGIGDPMLNYDVFIYIWGAAVKWKNGYQKEAVEILVGNVYNNHSLFPAQREELENIANSGKLFNDEWIKCFFQALYPFWLEGTGEEKLITFELNQILDL